MRSAIAAFLLTMTAVQLRADDHVVRYLDIWNFGISRRSGSERIPIVFRSYAGAWHSVCYYPGETTILFTGTFKDNDGLAPDGPVVYYHRSGAKAFAANFQNGAIQGQSRQYDMHGQLTGTTEWQSGDRHGSERRFRTDSALSAIRYWHSGKLDSAIYYHENGLIAEHAIRGTDGKLKTSCRDETGKTRYCAIFATRKAIPPPVFQAFCRDELRFTKQENRRPDSVLTLELIIDEHGDFHFGNLYRRRDGLRGGFALFKGLWENMNLMMPDLESAGSLSVREKIRERLRSLPKAVPAYEHCVAVSSIQTVDLIFE